MTDEEREKIIQERDAEWMKFLTQYVEDLPESTNYVKGNIEKIVDIFTIKHENKCFTQFNKQNVYGQRRVR